MLLVAELKHFFLAIHQQAWWCFCVLLANQCKGIVGIKSHSSGHSGGMKWVVASGQSISKQLACNNYSPESRNSILVHMISVLAFDKLRRGLSLPQDFKTFPFTVVIISFLSIQFNAESKIHSIDLFLSFPTQTYKHSTLHPISKPTNHQPSQEPKVSCCFWKVIAAHRLIDKTNDISGRIILYVGLIPYFPVCI